MSQSVELKAVASKKPAVVASKKPAVASKKPTVVVADKPTVVSAKKPAVVRKIKIKNPAPTLPIVEERKQSVWLGIRNRTPPVKKTLPIVWEHIEDISDDEDDTPEAAKERAETMKETKARLNRRAYENKLDELQGAGLLLTWSEEKPLKIHPNQCMVDGQKVILTWVYQ
jgi:hypothetical protein